MRLRYILPVFPLIALVLVATGTGLWLPGPPVQVWIPAAPQNDGILLAEYEKGPSTTAHAAVLYERSTGTVLYGKEMHTRRAPASTTKVMTALLAIELGRMDDIVTVSRKAAGVPGSSARLYPDQKIRLLDLLYGLLLNSGNDAAVAIAEHIAGSEEAFVALMNERARELGLENTRFQNPHGLDAPGHYSTAYDLAILTDTAMNYPLFAQIVATREHVTDHGAFRNTNRLLWSMEGALGVKTGTTGQAGYCLVAAVSGEGMELISVVLGSSDRWADSIRLLNYGFDEFHLLTLVERGSAVAEIDLPTAMGPVVAVAERPITVVVRSDRPAEVETQTVIERLRTPVRPGQPLGRLEVQLVSEGRQLTIPLVAKGGVARRTPLRVLWEWLTGLL